MKKIVVFFLICLPLYSQSKFNFQNHVIESLKGIKLEIKELKLEIKKINEKVDRNYRELNDRINRNYRELSHRIDKLNDKIDNRFYMIFFTILTVFTALFIFIAQRTQPIHRENTKPYKEPRAKVIPKKKKVAT